MRGLRHRWIFVLVAMLGSCASPAVTLYTLATLAQPGSMVPLGQHPIIIAVSRVALPDDLDTQDILVRKGSVLERSSTGRWASRLSLGITDLVTERLAETRPDALVTDQPQATTAAYTIRINISRLDLASDGATADGTAVLTADWQIVPRNPSVPETIDRARIDVAGSVATDRAVVDLMTKVLTQLTAAIDIRRLP